MVTVNQTKVSMPFVAANIDFSSSSGSGVGMAESFVITPDCADDRAVIIVRNANASGKAVSIYFDGGEFMSTGETAPISIPAGKDAVIRIDSAFVKKDNGAVVLIATPPSDVSLETCMFSVACVSFLQVETR